jgi:hypothetical protein
MLDDRIDKTAHELTRGGPDEAFRARVVARIEARGSGLGAWAPGLAGALAVMGVAAVASIAIYRVDRVPPSSVSVGPSIPPPALFIPPAAPAPSSAPSSPAAPVPPAVAASRSTAFADAPEGFESIAVQPLPIEEIEIVALDQPRATVIEALTIAPIEIGSLSDVDQH